MVKFSISHYVMDDGCINVPMMQTIVDEYGDGASPIPFDNVDNFSILWILSVNRVRASRANPSWIDVIAHGSSIQTSLNTSHDTSEPSLLRAGTCVPFRSITDFS